MPEKITAGSWGAVILTVGFALAATPAQAGFEWVAPNDGAAYQAPPAVVAAPQMPATSVPEVISPVIITGNPRPAQAAPSSSRIPPAPVSVPIVSLSPSAPPPAPAKGEEKVDLATATISVSPGAGDDIVQGFASQIPLALALRQLLPSGYSFSIDQNVDMNTLVSYKSGASWRETLTTMLASAGLAAHEQGTAFTVSRAAAPAPAAAEAPPPPPPPIAPAMNVGPSPYPASPVMHADESVPNVGMAEGWSAERGDTLRKVLTDWCGRANVELQWLAEYDYPVEASAHFNGGFEDAVRGLLAGFSEAQPQPTGELHTNSNAGQMVLVVQARGNSYSN